VLAMAQHLTDVIFCGGLQYHDGSPISG
jgi:hypothetical protein